MLMYSNVRNFIQNVSVMKGSHSFKFGAELRLVQFPFVQFSDPHGDFNFSNNATAFPNNALSSNTGDGIASFLLGAVDTGTISSTNFISSQKQTWGFYGQDDWKVNRKLTLNMGMRYELFSPTYERFGRESNFEYPRVTLVIPKGNNQDAALPPNFASTFPNVTVSRGQVSKYMMGWDKWDFGPRFGLAYNVAPKTVLRAGFGIFYGGEENLGGDPNLGEAAPFNFTVQLLRTDRSLNGIDQFASNPWFPGGFHSGWANNVFSLPAPVYFHSLGTDNRSPMVQKWNVAIQRELPWQTALEVAYIGNHQSHQYVTHDGNACPNLGTANSAINCETLRPIPYIGKGVVTNTFGIARYNAFTAKLEKRMSGGVEFISSYTWSHTLTNAKTPLVDQAIQDPTNFSTAYANALWDIRHNFTTGFTWEVPVGKGRAHGANLNPVLNHIVGGWGLNGILSLRTGRPNTITDNMADCQGAWVTCRVDVVPGRDPNNAPSGGRSWAKWFDTSAVRAAAPLTGGNLGLLTLIGPGTSTLDTSLFKNFRFNERFNLEFRMEAFNLFNKVQLGNPDVNFQDSTFGQINGASGERKAQISLRLRF